MQLEQITLVIGAVNLVAVGVAWGNLSAGHAQLREDIYAIKKVMGMTNGSPPSFMRREECALHHGNVNQNLTSLLARIDDQGHRIESLHEAVIRIDGDLKLLSKG